VTETSRALVRTGIAEYFGGTNYNAGARAYQGSSPLLGDGLSTVRAYQPKRISDTDYVLAQAQGRGMGASMVVELADDAITRRTLPARGGAHPQSSGHRKVVYRTTLHLFHLAHQNYAEDAEADVDALIQAVLELIYSDVTLGMGVTGSNLGVYQCGESASGIRVHQDPSVLSNDEITATHISIDFDTEVEIVA
jgi:hypothetical protein